MNFHLALDSALAGSAIVSKICLSLATRGLLGTFQQVDFVVLCGVAGGVPHFTDGNQHVRLGDVVVSGSVLGDDEEVNGGDGSHGRVNGHAGLKEGVYFYLESVRKRRNTDEDGEEPPLSLEDQVAGFEAKSWRPPSLELQQLTRRLKAHVSVSSVSVSAQCII